jgi:hypothetical protein
MHEQNAGQRAWGCSDIVATTSPGRLPMSLETLCGVTLLLFGVEIILASDRRK